MRAAEWRARAAWTMGAGPGQSAETDSDEEDAEERARRRRDRAPGSTPSHAGPDIGALTLDDVVGPPPGALDPSGFEFSPDDEHVAYLHAHLPHDPASAWTAWTLLVLDVSSGTRHACFDPTSTYGAGGATATDVSRERESAMGVTRYEWAREATNPSRLLVPRPEGAYVVDVEKIFSPRGDDAGLDAKSKSKSKTKPSRFGATTRVSPPRCVARASRDAPVLDASVSPDGRWVAFVRRSEIHIAPCDASCEDQDKTNAAHTHTIKRSRLLEARATHGARGRPFVTHGLAEFVAAEEMGRDRGFWWRPDSGALAFTRVDSSRVETVDVTRGYALGAGGEAQGEADDAVARDGEPRAKAFSQKRHDAEAFAKKPPSDEKHSYPHAGRENARVTLGVVDVSSLTLERDAAKRDATLRRAADPEVPDPELFPVTWMDVDCGSSSRSLLARGEQEEYLASVAWVPTPSPRGTPRERASDESAESAESDANVSRKRFSFLPLGFPNASSRRTLEDASDSDASSREMSRHALLVRVQNRAQTQITSIFIDAATGERATLARDASSMLERVDDDSDAWVNITQNPIVLKKGDPTGGDHAAPGDAVVVSERDGYAHAYLARVGENRGPPTQLTAGAWCVHRVHAVDENRGWVYFTANERGPLERHLYRARLWPSTFAKATAKEARLEVAPPTRLTRAAGCHTVSLDHAFARFVDVRENLRTPPVAVMRAIPRSSEDDDVVHETETDASTPRDEALAVGEEENQTQKTQRHEGSHDEPNDTASTETFARVDAALRATVATYAATYASYKAPSLVRVPAADGVSTLYGALYLPDKDVFGNGPFPCVVAVYGGPGAQCVVDAWRLTADARAQRLRGRGVATLKLDNRGTANRGCAFERAIRSNGAVLGECEVADQAAGVRFLVEKKIVDPKRVAIVGWSYGGFVAAAALLRAPETFACAVAGAPVTSWLAYNAHYAERYLGAPDAAGGASRYRRCDLLTFVRERARRDPRGWLAFRGTSGKKKMLLAHGASDENVHLSHTARLADALDALDAAAARFHEETEETDSVTDSEEPEEETSDERNDDAFVSSSVSRETRDGRRNTRRDSRMRARFRRRVSSSFDVVVFARERHVPRGRVARREFEERIDAFLADAFE